MKKRGIWGCDGRYNREQWKCVDSFDAIWRAGCSRGGGGGGWQQHVVVLVLQMQQQPFCGFCAFDGVEGKFTV